MRKIIICMLSVVGLWSCKAPIQDFGELDFFTDNDAIVKINMASVYPDDRYMYVKFNDKRVTPGIRAREPYPGGGYNTRGPSNPDFLRIGQGAVNIKVCIPHRVDNGLDSLVLSEQTVNLKGGARYTIHVADTAANTKMFVAEENLIRPDSTFATYRFVNLMPNVEALDLYYGAAPGTTEPIQDSLIARNIKYGEMSPYFTIRRATTRSWKIRRAGDPVTNASVLAFYTNASSTLDRRSYTAYALGYAGFPTTNTIMRPYIAFYLIR